MALRRIAFSVVFAAACLSQAQSPAPAPKPQSERVIVKLKPALVQEAEAEFPAAMPVQQMHIRAGQARSPRVQAFIGRYSARQLSPMYPEIVRLKVQHGWSDAQFAEHLRQRFAARARRRTQPAAVPELSRTYVLEVGAMAANEKAQLIQRLKADPDVEFAEPEHTFSSKQITNDPFLSSSGSWGQPYPDLWGLLAIGAPTAWDTATGTGVVVAVVDTGIDYNHPDIAANVWTNPNEIDGNFVDDDGNGFVDDARGWNFVFQNNDPSDHNGHGTHVAGTIAAVGDNGIGVIGVAWHAHVMAVKGLDDSGFGFDFTLAPAILYAASNGADIINASWGGESSSQSIEEAIQFAAGLGVVFVAAAGNSSEDAMNFFPASSPEAITVAASDPFGNFAFFSNFGPKIDVTAPGVDILSLQAAFTFLGPQVADGYIRLDGTSMAAPHVSGVAALSLSQNPAYSTEQVRQVIRSSATPVDFDSRFGYGKLNAAAAVAVTNPLEARITGLQFPGGPGGSITINGFAQGAGFSNYVLEYGFGTQPSFFNPFFASVTPASGTLGILDPVSLGLFDGTYTIRLTAFNTNGAGFTDRTQFTLVLVAITSPVPTSTFKPGFQLPIVGTATMPGFSNFTVQWSRQDGVGGLQNTGITLTGDGLSPLAGATLATWDTSSITEAGYYNIILTVNGASFEQASTTVYLEPDLLSTAWPVFLDLGPCLECPPVPALNPDGTNRLLIESSGGGTGGPGALWSIHPDGSSQKTLLSSVGAVHQPSAGSIDNLPGDEIVAVDFNVVDIFHPDGTLDVFSPNADVFLTNSALALADLNNDFQLESIAVGTNLFGTAAYLYAWQPNGQQVSGFPIPLQEHNNLYGIFNLTRVIAGDFAGDGSKEILVIEGLTSTTYGLSLFNHDGTRKPFNAPILTGVPAALAAADLDHNGKLETILLNHSDFLGTQATIHVFQPDGSERPGWPVDVSASHSSFFSFPGAAVGDLNRDGHEEIVLSNGSGLYVFNTDGTLLSSAWPVPMVNTTTYLRPLIADINGDGFPEIVVPFDDFNSGGLQLRAFERDGSVLKSWALTGMNGFPTIFDAAATVGDFNQDGSTDIALAYGLQPPAGDSVFKGVVTILDTHSPYVAANNDWPMVLQNPRNNPVLLRPTPSSLAVSLTSGTNPSITGDALTFTATVTPVGNGSVQFMDGDTPLSGAIPLSTGSGSFTTSTLALGSHSITARYTGDNLRSPSVSPALVQTVIRGNTSISVSLTSGTNPALVGDTLTFTATVAPSTATGTVVFFDGSTQISGEVPLVSGLASLTTSTLSFGTHSITAQYISDNNFNGSTSTAFVETINNPKTNTSVTLVLQSGTNPSLFGSTLTFSATVTPTSATGTVTFFDGTVPISDNLPLIGGVASFTTSVLGAGTHSITAQYSGDANFNGAVSTTLVQNVAKATTEVDLERGESTTAINLGQPVTFIATITPASATGTVVFFDGTTAISDPILVSNGSASFTTASLTVGSHSISAGYSGDANFNAASSNTLPVKVK